VLLSHKTAKTSREVSRTVGEQRKPPNVRVVACEPYFLIHHCPTIRYKDVCAIGWPSLPSGCLRDSAGRTTGTEQKDRHLMVIGSTRNIKDDHEKCIEQRGGDGIRYRSLSSRGIAKDKGWWGWRLEVWLR
jgi:hypothetical protein